MSGFDEAYPLENVLEQLLSVATTTCVGLSPQVEEVVGVAVAIAQHLALGGVEQAQHLIIVTPLPLGRQSEVESPHTAPEDRPPVIQLLSRWHPTRRGEAEGSLS